MARPLVSFVFPAHPAAAERLRWSVAALQGQTVPVDRFECIVAVDGEDPERRIESVVAAASRPFRCEVVYSSRTPGLERVPHRNHARNAGCQVASGEWLWVLDADIIADTHAVEHLESVAAVAARPLVVSPCLAEPACSPSEWLAAAPAWAGRYVQWTSSGKLGRYRPGRPSSVHLPRLIEGQPAFPRWLWEALGGYDERFLAWGGNKIELCRRLRFLDMQQGVLEVHLLTSCRFIHQPHEKDPLHFDRRWREHNDALFYGKQRDMQGRASWWMAEVERVRAAIAA